MVPTHESAPLPAAHDGSGYRLFGNFYLSSPELHLHQHALRRLRQLEPHLRQLEFLATPECQTKQECEFNLAEEFREFQELESTSWAHPRRKDELVAPSGSLMWPIAHHLHNPSFQSLTPHEVETEDATSACIWMVIAENFVSGKTLIFDHLSRRESIDGLQVYPQPILDIHETWLSKIRSNMAAKVEVVYGKKVRERMPQIYDLEPLQLWGEYEDIFLYLEWSPIDKLSGKSLARFVVPAYHPQVFLSPGGTRYGARQDTILRAAHELASLKYEDGFYKNFNTAMINKCGIRPHHYDKSSKFAIIAGKELAKNVAEMSKPKKLRPISRVQLPPDASEIVRFSQTKVSQKYVMDSARPSVVQVKCKACGLPDKDYKPLWCAKSGKYIARRKRCRDERCTGRLTIPQDSQLGYIAYSGLEISAHTSAQRPAELTYSPQAVATLSSDEYTSSNFVQDPEPGSDLTSSKLLVEGSLPNPSKPLIVSSALPSPTSKAPVASKGYNSRESRQLAQIGERGPFEYWHGRKPVMNKMGRVRIWVLHNKQSKAVKIQRLDISTYGPYLLKTGSRVLDFNVRGISLVSSEGKELWHASLDKLRSRQNGGDLVQHHQHELEKQTQTSG